MQSLAGYCRGDSGLRPTRLALPQPRLLNLTDEYCRIQMQSEPSRMALWLRTLGGRIRGSGPPDSREHPGSSGIGGLSVERPVEEGGHLSSGHGGVGAVAVVGGWVAAFGDAGCGEFGDVGFEGGAVVVDEVVAAAVVGEV